MSMKISCICIGSIQYLFPRETEVVDIAVCFLPVASGYEFLKHSSLHRLAAQIEGRILSQLNL